MIAVCQVKGVQLDGQLDYFGFRGKAEDWSGLMLQLKTKLATAGYVLIIIDPIYKGLGGKDENKAGDVASLLNEIEGLCVQSGAAVVYGHHFAKGSQKFKNVEDRSSGSGVWARDPDSNPNDHSTPRDRLLHSGVGAAKFSTTANIRSSLGISTNGAR